MLEVRDLCRAYGAFMAVDHVSFAVRKGELLTMLGSSGSGKSTALNIIAGLDRATSGEVLVAGKPITNKSPHKRDIGMVFQRYTLFPHMSVLENVAFPLAVRSIPREQAASRAREALALVQLSDKAGRRPSQLSGGQQQRVAIARAIVYRPSILLMDEPLGALDKQLREEIQWQFKQLQSELGITTIYVTHDQEEALRLSDRIAIMSNGRIQQLGSGKDLYDRPANDFVGRFFGNSNFLSGKVVSANDKTVGIDVGGTTLTFPAKPRHAVGDQVSIMFRPERGRLLAFSPIDGRQGLPVTVVSHTFLGDTASYEVATNQGQKIYVKETAGAVDASTVSVGENALLLWPPERTHIFGAS